MSQVVYLVKNIYATNKRKSNLMYYLKYTVVLKFTLLNNNPLKTIIKDEQELHLF